MKSSSWKSSCRPAIVFPVMIMPVVRGVARSRAGHKVAVVAGAALAVSRKSIARVPTTTVVAVRENRRPVAAAIRPDRIRLSG